MAHTSRRLPILDAIHHSDVKRNRDMDAPKYVQYRIKSGISMDYRRRLLLVLRRALKYCVIQVGYTRHIAYDIMI